MSDDKVAPCRSCGHEGNQSPCSDCPREKKALDPAVQFVVGYEGMDNTIMIVADTRKFKLGYEAAKAKLQTANEWSGDPFKWPKPKPLFTDRQLLEAYDRSRFVRSLPLSERMR